MAPNDIKSLFTDMGTNILGFINTPKILYAIYFFAFFFALFTIFNLLLQKVQSLKGKPAKVIAFTITIISTGGIFTKWSTEAALVDAFHGFTGFILMLAIAIVIIGGGYVYAFPKDKSKEKEKLTQTVIMSWAIYIGISILLPVFKNVFMKNNAETAVFIHTILSLFSSVSFIVALISTIIFGINLLSFGTDSISEEKKKKGNKKDEKDIAGLKELLGLMEKSINKINEHFGRKINLANDMVEHYNTQNHVETRNRVNDPNRNRVNGGNN